MIDVTICVPTIEPRLDMLAEALQSIYDQTVVPSAVLVRADMRREGIQVNGQALLNAVQTEWCMFCSDDDLLDADHLLTLITHSADAEVVYSYCRSVGRHTYTSYNQPFDPDLLERSSIVAHTALFRTDWARRVGGFPNRFGEDWLLWRALSHIDARFVSVPKVTWTYRFHGRNLSHGELV